MATELRSRPQENCHKGLGYPSFLAIPQPEYYRNLAQLVFALRSLHVIAMLNVSVTARLGPVTLTFGYLHTDRNAWSIGLH